jgi:hypothetical protein
VNKETPSHKVLTRAALYRLAVETVAENSEMSCL